MDMIKTTAGLPNTCSQCGKWCPDHWYAPHLQAALAGQGKCGECAGVTKPEPAPKRQRRSKKES